MSEAIYYRDTSSVYKPTHDSEFVAEVDTYLQRLDTPFTQKLYELCPLVGKDYLNSRVKRSMDLAAGIIGFALVAPVIVPLGIAANLEDGGKPLYVQHRLGKDGRGFGLIKIRVMRENSDRGDEEGLLESGKYEPHNDPRATRLGRFLRKYQIEEIPQLLQVFIGYLSLVGIRAARPGDVRLINKVWGAERAAKWWCAYSSGRPGLTGANQVFNQNSKDVPTREHWDLWYTQNASLHTDVFILWRTVAKMTGTKLPQFEGFK